MSQENILPERGRAGPKANWDFKANKSNRNSKVADLWAREQGKERRSVG